MRNWKILLLKISALFCFCGGPLFIWNRSTRQEQDAEELSNQQIADEHKIFFIILFIPIGMVMMGCMVMVDNDPNDRLSRWVLYGGGVGMAILCIESLYAIIEILFLNGSRYNFNSKSETDDTTLIMVGCFVTFLTTLIYSYLSRQWFHQQSRSSSNFSPVSIVEIP